MVFAKGHVWVHGPPNLPFAASHLTERSVHLELVSWSQLSTVPSLHPASIFMIPIFHDVCELGTSVCPLFVLRVDTAPFTAQGLLKRVCWELEQRTSGPLHLPGFYTQCYQQMAQGLPLLLLLLLPVSRTENRKSEDWCPSTVTEGYFPVWSLLVWREDR